MSPLETGIEKDALKGCRLLLAEDHMTVASSLSFLLKRYSCCVTQSARCDETLALLETQPFDIALLDITLADGSVYPAAEALAARRIPFLFLTGFSEHNLPQSWSEWPIIEKTDAPDKIVRHLLTLYRGR